MAVAKNHQHQTDGVPLSPPIPNQQTILGSRRLLIEIQIRIQVVEVILVLETQIQEDTPNKIQVAILQVDTRLVEVTRTNLEEGITQTKTLLEVIQEQVGIQVQVVIPTTREEGTIPINTLEVGTLQREVIQTSIQEQVDIPLLGVTLTQDGEVAIQSEEEGALVRVGVHQAPILAAILVVE